MHSTLCVFLAWIGVTLGYGGTAFAAGQVQDSNVTPGLKIVVLEGDDGVNIVKKKSAVKPVVEVRDRNDMPVAGASVVFALPNSGATAAFANGGTAMTVVTNSAGRAAIAGMKPVGTGAFKISVTASFHGQTAAAAISQTNYLTVAAAHAAGAAGAGGGASGSATAGGAAGAGGGLSGGAIAGIVAGVVAAAAASIVAAKSGSKTPSLPAHTTPAGTIGLGTGPVFGPVH